MLKGFLTGSFLSGAASAGADAANARSDAANANVTAKLANDRANRASDNASMALDSATIVALAAHKVAVERNELRERLEHIYDEFGGITRSVNGFMADDACLRAVLRDLLAAIRENSPNHPFLDKDNRDRMYGEAFEAAFLSEPNRGWAAQVGNMKALESLVDAGTDALRQVAPGHRLLDLDEQALVYWEAWEREAAKVDKAVNEKDPRGAWLPDRAPEIGKAASKILQARKFNPSSTRKRKAT